MKVRLELTLLWYRIPQSFSYVSDVVLMLISWNELKRSSVVSIKTSPTLSSLTFNHRPGNYDHIRKVKKCKVMREIRQRHHVEHFKTRKAKTKRQRWKVFSEREKRAGRQSKWLAGKVWELVGTTCRTRKRKPWKHTSDYERIVEVTNGTSQGTYGCF